MDLLVIFYASQCAVLPVPCQDMFSGGISGALRASWAGLWDSCGGLRLSWTALGGRSSGALRGFWTWSILWRLSACSLRFFGTEGKTRYHAVKLSNVPGNFLRSSMLFKVRASRCMLDQIYWEVWCPPGQSWPLLGVLLAALAALFAKRLGHSWGAIDRSWGVLGRSWAALGALLGRLWLVLACSWGTFRRSGDAFGALKSWAGGLSLVKN